jgi:hypothetical protein
MVTSSEPDYPCVLTRLNGAFVFRIPALGVEASGQDINSAYADLERATRIVLDRHARSGGGVMPPPVIGTLKPSRSGGRSLGSTVVHAAAATATVLVIAGMALGGAVSWGAGKLRNVDGRAAVAGVLGYAEALTDRRREELRRQIGRAVERVKPLADEVRPLFEPAACGPAEKPHT